MIEPFYQDPREALRVLYNYLLENPDEMGEMNKKELLLLTAPFRSPAQAIADTAEYFFARKSDLPKASSKVGAMLASVATYYNINNFATDGGTRGRAIQAALRRHSGEKAPDGMSWPKKEDDPVPLDIYLPPPGADGPVPPPVIGPEVHPISTETQEEKE